MNRLRAKPNSRPGNPLRLQRELDTHQHPLRDARAERVFRQAVAHEMLLARESTRDPQFDPTDARWRLAQETERALQGAVLAYEDRKGLLALAQRLGIRPFDANLIVALVQDRARRGESIESAAPTIALLPKPTLQRSLAWLWVTAISAAIATDAVLIGWLIFR